MKKLFVAILSFVFVFALAACGNSNTGGVSSSSMLSSEASSPEAGETSSDGEVSLESQPSVEPEQGKILIAYFSWSGNTEKLAGIIHDEIGGDLFEITPATPYTEDYDALLDQAQQEKSENVRPELANQVENWEDYDVIFVGFPNWWSDTPMAVLTFLESYDFTGKTLVPFCTHGGGGFGSGLSSVESSASGATLLDGFDVNGSSVEGAQGDVASWISGLQLGE